MVNIKRAPDNDNAQKNEYSIYTFRRLLSDQSPQNSWEKCHTTTDRNMAFKRAKVLYKRDEYQKVEVKQKRFDSRKSRPIDETLKIFEHKPEGSIKPHTILMFAILCGLAGFGMSCILSSLAG